MGVPVEALSDRQTVRAGVERGGVAKCCKAGVRREIKAEPAKRKRSWRNNSSLSIRDYKLGRLEIGD